MENKEAMKENLANCRENEVDPVTEDLNLEKKVSSILKEMGVSAHLKGYKYVRYSIMLGIKNQELIENITKILYPTVAKKFNTTSSKVERAIRNAIESAWERGNHEIFYKYFGNTISSKKPTNSEFIANIVDYYILVNCDKID